MKWLWLFFSRTIAAQSPSSLLLTPSTGKLNSSHPKLPMTPGGCLQGGLTQVSCKVFFGDSRFGDFFLGLLLRAILVEAFMSVHIYQGGCM